MSETIERDAAASQDTGAVRASVINQFGATGNINDLMDSVDIALANKQVFAPAAEGEMQPGRAAIVARKEQIRSDLENALKFYKGAHEGMQIGDDTKGKPPAGTSIQSVVDQYVAALKERDKDPQKVIPLEFLARRIDGASETMRTEIGNEATKLIRQAAVQKAMDDARAATGPVARAGSQVDRIVASTRQAVTGEPMGRRTALLAALGFGGLGAAALVQNGCPKKPAENVDNPTPIQTPEPKLPVNFSKEPSQIPGSGAYPPEMSTVLKTERAGNTLLFVDKDTKHIGGSDGNYSKGHFYQGGTTEIHMTDPTRHAQSITIDTPSYVREDMAERGRVYGATEKNRTKVDLCFHPSVLANYTISADSIMSRRGDTTQDVVLSFDPKPGVSIDKLEPFEIVIKGHGVDKGGVFNNKRDDQSGIDQIKLVDSRGQVIQAVDAVKLSTAREFGNALNTLQLEAGRSNDAPTPMSVENSDNLVHYAGKRFQDISHSHGEGKTTRRTPTREGRW